MTKADLNVVYADLLRNHPEGHALYFKVAANQMKPGDCGYFSENGQWKQIVGIASVESKDLASQGWKPPIQILKTETQHGIEWPIKVSESVTNIKVSAKLGASVPGAPISGGSTMSFSTKRGAGAILITAGEVISHQLERDLQAYKWVIQPQNMQKLLSDWEEISDQKRTLWMITGTYAAQSCALSVLHSPESSASIGMDFHVADIARANPSLEWWKEDSDKTWMKYKDDAGVVLFMSGIAFKTSFLRRSELHAEYKRRKQHLYRHAATSNLQYPMEEDVATGDPMVAIVVPEYIGQESKELEYELEHAFVENQSDSDVSDEGEDD